MKKKLLAGFVGVMLLFFVTEFSQAALTKIGSVTFAGSDYNLIWDNDNNGRSLVWLDYISNNSDWASQKFWANGLNQYLTYKIEPAYTISWNDDNWRLPYTVDGVEDIGYNGTTTAGWNITSSEMGHLYYEELGNLGFLDTSGIEIPPDDYGLLNTGIFDNLIPTRLWSDTEYSHSLDMAWYFNMSEGDQYAFFKDFSSGGLFVRSGDVSSVPIPSAMYILGSGLIGVVGIMRRFQK